MMEKISLDNKCPACYKYVTIHSLKTNPIEKPLFNIDLHEEIQCNHCDAFLRVHFAVGSKYYYEFRVFVDKLLTPEEIAEFKAAIDPKNKSGTY